MAKQLTRTTLPETLVIMGILILTLCSAGCAGDRIEYDPPELGLIGMVVTFKEPMGYIILSEKDNRAFDRETVKIGRQLESWRELLNEFGLSYKYPREPIKDGMSFTIIGSYWVRGSWLDKAFAHDLHKVILKDENSILSVCRIRAIDSIDTDITGAMK
jgi:hypothetical protein